MKLLGTILLSLFATVVVQAQNADTYFHQSANSYINSQIQQALETVDEGLSRYPNDAKLNELKRKLEEEKEKTTAATAATTRAAARRTRSGPRTAGAAKRGTRSARTSGARATK